MGKIKHANFANLASRIETSNETPIIRRLPLKINLVKQIYKLTLKRNILNFISTTGTRQGARAYRHRVE